jgi:hypothetical protein
MPATGAAGGAPVVAQPPSTALAINSRAAVASNPRIACVYVGVDST